MSLLLALLLDRLCGEPPARLHPVVWIGSYLRVTGRRLPDWRPSAAFVGGWFAWVLGAVLFTAPFVVAHVLLEAAPWWVGLLATALLLKPLFALRLLCDEVAGVEAALARGLDAGRGQLARIVSRDTSTLSATEVRESALESLSENLSDSVVAPLFWFALLGLPGAAMYRFSNTADAMWGYRGRWEWAGKWAARADDCLNLVPARLTALSLALGSRGPVLRRLRTEARRTPSPNSGWPMAAFALAHSIRLGKPGVYVLNPEGRVPTSADTAAGVRHATRVAWLLGGALALLAVARTHWLHG